MTPLAITGLGVVGPLGIGKDAWFKGMRAVAEDNHNFFQGTREVLAEDKFPDARVAEAWGFDATQYLGSKGLRNLDRFTKILIVAAKLALEDAGIKKDGAFVGPLQPDDVGLCSSTAYGSLEAITEMKLVAELEDPRYVNPARFPNTVINAAAGYVSIWEDLRALNVTIVDGNCGALDAALTSSTHLAHQRAQAMLIGGGEALSEPLYLAFQKLGIVAKADATFAPGNPASQGARLGDGAGFICVEPIKRAKARQQKISALLRGYGTAFEAPDSEALLVNASQDAVARAIDHALADANLKASEISLVVSALSGLAVFDLAELQGIRKALGKVGVVAPKNMHGETFGASGALAMVDALAWLEGVPLPQLVAGSAPSSLEHVLVLAVGYYGNVSAVVLSKAN